MIIKDKCPMCGKHFPEDLSESRICFCSQECSEKWLEKYNANPFVTVTGLGSCNVNSRFVPAAVPFQELNIQTVLELFEIDWRYIGAEQVINIEKSIKRGRSRIYRYDKAEMDLSSSNTALRILARRMAAMQKMVEDDLTEIGTFTKAMLPYQRKELCTILGMFSRDPGRYFTIHHICKAINISPSSYQKYKHDKEYGATIEYRDQQAEKYVREVFEYKGYPKGVRMVYMMLPKITGQKFGLDRVRRIMRKYGMDCGIRVPSQRKKEVEENLKDRRKPNLLRRMFRLHRPNEVRLTDVTYIQCNNDFKAYGSALIDPVTGMLVTFIVSLSNDLELAMTTLQASDKHPCANGGVFHSDQGTLYLSPTFQEEVVRLGLKQSMSKRGNCWDNSPQESFFGHFKDDCKAKYERCTNIHELEVIIDKYAYYYNNERPQWNRNQMTPVEYERYLLSLTEGEFRAYMEREMGKYIEMKESAKRKAIERAKTLGVEED